MAVTREFLDWDRPGLVSAVDYLERRFGQAGLLDLRRVVIVVPGGRAGRRLLELLVDRSGETGLALFPPTILTQGKLPERLYRPKRPFADDLVQQLAWVEAIRTSDPACVAAVFPTLPDADDLTAWLALGQMLSRLHRELSADALDFDGVADCGAKLPGFREAARWRALAEIQKAYLRRLDELGLWDKQTARLVAIRLGECATEDEIVLLAAVDMNIAERHMVDQVDDRVTSLVIAPESLKDRFDSYGCLLPAAWRDVALDLAPERIEVVGGPADQAAAAVRALASWDGRFRGEQITIGVPDTEVIPYLEQYLKQAGVPARYGVGLPARGSAPFRLLEAVAAYLDGRRFPAWAALTRHPDVERWLLAQKTPDRWLCELDDYYEQHLPSSLTDPWLGPAGSHSGLKRAHRALEQLLKPLAGHRRLDEWGEAIVDLLTGVFGAAPLDPTVEPDRTTLSACESIRGVLDAQRRMPPSLAPTVSGSEAIRLVLREMTSDTVPAMPVRGAIELLGWLELPLDDAPALVVTGLNEGRVPESLNADLFLPNRLRLALGIEDNDRRYARDAYALAVLAASRAELRVIAGHRSADGSPLAPSRLLFACDKEEAARRVLDFFSRKDEGLPSDDLPGRIEPGLTLMDYEAPGPRPLTEPVTSMRVTEFRDYLACPYRYYLRHRLGLVAQSDDGQELDGAAFGSLAHEVLRAFGESELAGGTDPETLSAWLGGALDEAVRAEYGSSPLAAIRVQVEQLRRRLTALARWQASWAAEGWQILRVEAVPEEPGASLVVDGEPMRLRGRIDRIDVHRTRGELFLIDYKTSDRAHDPDKIHRQGESWIDLQLPLYRHLVRAMGLEGRVRLGYVNLPKDTGAVGLAEAEWTPEDLDAADRTAEDVVRKVRRAEFGRPVQPPPDFFDDFAAICGDGPFAAVIAAAADEGENGP